MNLVSKEDYVHLLKSTAEVCEMLGMTNPQINRFVKEGKLNPIKIVAQRFLFDVRDVEDFKKSKAYWRLFGFENQNK